jgi:hypothetical protein
MYGVALQKYFVAGCMLGMLSSSAMVSAQDLDSPFVTFRVPRSTYTYPISINNSLTVMGVYADAKNTYHGFLRYAWGEIISFDPRGSTFTSPSGLNDSGAITGFYVDTSGTHGFVRSPEGAFTSFDVPNSPGTLPVSINADGTVAGYSLDVNYNTNQVLHGFVRSRRGVITSFDAGPEGGSTITAGINGSGTIIGRVQAQSPFGGGLEVYGFERSPQGVITSLPIYEPYGINAKGAITGIAFGVPNLFGADISPQGVITTFEAPGAFSTIAATINDEGTIAGQYFVEEGDNDTHGFVRFPKGTITSFDPPGSTGTIVSSINDLGFITGEVLHANNVYYGFIRIPARYRSLLTNLPDDASR